MCSCSEGTGVLMRREIGNGRSVGVFRGANQFARRRTQHSGGRSKRVGKRGAVFRLIVFLLPDHLGSCLRRAPTIELRPNPGGSNPIELSEGCPAAEVAGAVELVDVGSVVEGFE